MPWPPRRLTLAPPLPPHPASTCEPELIPVGPVCLGSCGAPEAAVKRERARAPQLPSRWAPRLPWAPWLGRLPSAFQARVVTRGEGEVRTWERHHCGPGAPRYSARSGRGPSRGGRACGPSPWPRRGKGGLSGGARREERCRGERVCTEGRGSRRRCGRWRDRAPRRATTGRFAWGVTARRRRDRSWSWRQGHDCR